MADDKLLSWSKYWYEGSSAQDRESTSSTIVHACVCDALLQHDDRFIRFANGVSSFVRDKFSCVRIDRLVCMGGGSAYRCCGYFASYPSILCSDLEYTVGFFDPCPIN